MHKIIFSGYDKKSDAKRIHRERRKAARVLGTHTQAEWIALKAEFNGVCVRCLGGSGLINVERDHITPIYQGGSDAIENIQPLCAFCNCSKGPENFNWKQYRRSGGSIAAN